MKLRNFKMFAGKSFSNVKNSESDEKNCMENHKDFQERLRKTLYYGKYTDGTLPSPIATDVAVKLINAKTTGKKSLDKCHAARMTRRARISPCALMMGILYTERLAQSNPAYLKRVSSSDLFMVSMLVASKYLYDDGEDEDAYNYDWSKAGNYHINDLNRLEREFLISIEWKIFISPKEFFEFVNKVETRVALDQGTERGWYSYMDIGTFLENVTFQDLLRKYVQSMGEVILSCTLAYSLSLVLLLSSPTIVSHFHEQQDIVNTTRELALLSSMSFLGQIGHLEHAMAVSLSQRKRQPRHQDVFKSALVDSGSCLKENCIQDTFQFGENCCKCGHSLTGVSYRPTRKFSAITTYKQVLLKCLFGQSSPYGIEFNKTDGIINQDFTVGFKQVYSFISFSFSCSWIYGAVTFPVWENSYSGILIGFSTSSAAVAYM